MEILFEDESVIVAVKERGLLSEETPEKPNMVTKLKEITNSEIYPIHRLDKEVGGVMVYAKTKNAAANLSKQVSDKIMEKTYTAVIHGVPEESGEMEDLLFFDKLKNKSFTVKKERKGVKKALLSYEVKDSKDELSLVEVRLHTGRTHQIRVQFASRKMPLVGDRRYGAKDDSKIIALFSSEISFIHPKTKEKMSFKKIPFEDVFAIK